MKILWVSTRFLYPLDSGGKIRSFNIIKRLGNFYDVTLVSLAKNSDSKYFDELKKHVKKCEFIEFSETKKDSIGFFFELALNLFLSLPYVIQKYRSSKMRDIINSMLSRHRYDLIVCDFLTPSVNLNFSSGIPKIIFQHNAETLIWQRAYKKEINPFKKIYFFLQFCKIKAYEKRVSKKFDLCIAVSLNDKEYFSKEFGIENVRVIPAGVDTEYFSPNEKTQQENTLVYVGNMGWFPSVDAVGYFTKEVLPIIKKKLSSLKFYIVGLDPLKKLFELAKKDDDIIVTGAVDDVRGYINRASVFVVPLRIGGGTRIKIYEAMACGKAIVSTSIGAEGLAVENKKNIILADTKEDFANAVIGFLKDKELRLKFGREARRHVEENCSWDNVVSKFSKYCEDAVTGTNNFSDREEKQ